MDIITQKTEEPIIILETETTSSLTPPISYDDFMSVDIRVGTIIEASLFPEARKPMHKFVIDFGQDIGLRRSCGQITQNYTPEQLVGKQVLGVVNFPEKQIGPYVSQALTLGFRDFENGVVLVTPEHAVPNGERLM
ncbi:MAG: tRNA-binding protein [Candidatus Yonathbacteria bacterium]|nr:tRNA-binding protein [Candidatus Yonathbacteria bacterium]NTW47467.1 tRNA-binding protein [Candidatus Yonathbacteria bacterium]